ncbi:MULTISPECIES: hypothetical protein [Halolamina]|uniref:Uncharacterized protein n=1 Tax=Halolamina pelagica TaxID=699431 RepID=A0A1I5TCZ2_9EURY|nr:MULTISPECIES: hypothetical protein [Halolamina]NHX37283.1 hypothetical protein [Halolamina sp. R1-12]SFP80848.1 hypothetical protein SAMN05216277_10915 [Halolamina pelagica]
MGEDSAAGGREPTVSDSELLELFDDADVPVLKTSELAEKIPIGERQVRSRLETLSEDDRVGSRMITAQNRVRLWWHSRIGVKRTWSSTEADLESIDVEVVDSLELPGRGEALQQRRQAVNSVFKFLFDNESDSAGRLKLVAWGADPDSYSSPESLWNNCVKKALDQSCFFRLFETEKEWQLTEMASWLRQHGDCALWNDWGTHRDRLDYECHDRLWTHVIGRHDSLGKPSQNHTSVLTQGLDFEGIDLYYLLTSDEPMWSGSSAKLGHGVQIQDDPEVLREIVQSKDRIEAAFSFTANWRDLIEEDSTVLVARTRSLDVDPNEVFKDETSRSLRNVKKWVEETQDQVIRVVENEITGF